MHEIVVLTERLKGLNRTKDVNLQEFIKYCIFAVRVISLPLQF